MRDERIQRNETQALANAALVGMMVVLVKIAYSVIKSTLSWETFIWDIGLLSLMSITIAISLYRLKDIDAPKSIFGQVLSTDQTTGAKKQRVNKAYLPSSILTAIIVTLLYIIFPTRPLNWTSILTDFVINFIIFFLMNFFWYEHEVKRYNKFFTED